MIEDVCLRQRHRLQARCRIGALPLSLEDRDEQPRDREIQGSNHEPKYEAQAHLLLARGPSLQPLGCHETHPRQPDELRV